MIIPNFPNMRILKIGGKFEKQKTTVKPLRTLISEYIFADNPASDITEILLGLILKP